MTMLRFIRSFLKDKSGGPTAEFAIVSFALFMTIFFVLELTLLFFNIMSAQAAANMGARVAIVSNPVDSAVPDTNVLTGANNIYGTSCGNVAAPCTAFSTVTCTGTECSETVSFNRILARVQQFLANVEAENVTLSYAYQGLGYAGGPVIPSVTLIISCVPYATGVLGGVLGSVITGKDINGSNCSGPSLPTVSVTLTGEDMSESGA